MQREIIIKSLALLGKNIKDISTNEFQNLAIKAINQNAWFTEESIRKSLQGIQNYLDYDKLNEWTSKYSYNSAGKLVGIVMAGNIPLVGLHDLLCVLLSGNSAVVKLSKDDSILINWFIQGLIAINPSVQERIKVVEKLSDIEAVIATGSNNTARYFEYYFSKYPHIIRKNRNSCAIIDGTERPEDVHDLGEDIFSYFGLGCRNVSKIYVPKNYDFSFLLNELNSYKSIIQHHKYANNYDYNKSILLVNKEEHLDNGFLLLKESQQIASPVSVLYYEYYQDLSKLKESLGSLNHEIQCIVSHKKNFPESVPFGKSQYPELWDYADNIDTMSFLNNL